MKRRILAFCLLLAILLVLFPGAAAAESACFIGINDTIPMYLSADQAPYYKGSILYIPYTVFQASPGGVTASYNAANESLALFTRAKRLVYDLHEGSVTDETQHAGKFEPVYRNGLLYIPASRALSHFGLSYTMLTSSSGATILRITDGSQKIDNTTFTKKAETLISIILEQETSQSDTGAQQPGEENSQNAAGPATVYLAFTEDAVSQQTLKALKDLNIHAAFFLSLEQIQQNRDLVREIYAAGHEIGLTAESGEADILSALSRANEALDQVLFRKSVMVLSENTVNSDQYVFFRYRAVQPTVEEVLTAAQAQLLVCRADGAMVAQKLRQEGAYLPQLLENTYIPGISS